MAFCQSCAAPIPDGTTQCANCLATPAAAPFTHSGVTPAPSGISINVAGALTYLGGFITGIIFLLVEPYKADRFVRFHAFQSIFFNVAWIALWIVWAIVGLVLGAVTKGMFLFIQFPIDLLLMVGGFALWAWLMYSAYQGKTFRLPVIGDMAAKQAGQ